MPCFDAPKCNEHTSSCNLLSVQDELLTRAGAKCFASGKVTGGGVDASGGGAPLLLCIEVALQVAKGAHCGKELLREGDGDGGNGAGGAAVDALRGAPRGAGSGLHLGRDAQACGDAVDAGEDRGQDVVHRPQCHDLQRPAFDHHWHLRVEACVQWEIMHSHWRKGGAYRC